MVYPLAPDQMLSEYLEAESSVGSPPSEDQNGELTDIGLLRSMKRIATSLHASASRSYPRTGQYQLDEELSRYTRLENELERRLRASTGKTKTKNRTIGG